MDIVTIDFETFYSKDFSLSKMTTEAYIRSPEFEVIGVGAKVNKDPAVWYSGSDVKGFLAGLDCSNKAILCHHTAFDGAILSWHFGIKPKLWLDTLSMARPLHQLTVGGSLKALAAYYGIGAKGEEVLQAIGKRKADFSPDELNRYGEYCKNDVELTYKLFRKLSKGFPISELMIIDQTLRMYTEPVIELDVPVLEKHLEEVRARKRSLLTGMGVGLGGEQAVQDILMSNQKFATYLQSLGVEPPTKISPKTGKESFAFAKTDKGMTDLLEHPDDRVQTAVSARLGVKSTLEETRTEALIGVAKRGRLPIMLNYYGAHTGRFSGGDKLNLQNLPTRSNNSIRRALKAPVGHKLISCDSSQIEARMVAYVAGQQDLIEAFAEGRDVYSEFATEIYDRKITKADAVERFIGKTCILGLGYIMGAERFRRTLEIGQGGISVKIELSEAERIVRLYRNKNHQIVSLWHKCSNMLAHMVNRQSGQIVDWIPYDSDGIILPNGLRIRYPALRVRDREYMYVAEPREFRKVATDEAVGINWTKIYGGKVTENLIQALARIVVAEQMAEVGQHYRVAFQVHDEIVIVVKDAEAAHAQKHIEQIMSTAPAWAAGLPVACESGMADSYGET